MTIAETTLQQLGGRRFIAMTGATCYSDKNTLVVKFKGSKIANLLHVTLTEMDTYQMKFSKFRGMEVKEVETVENAYCDNLAEIFESVTKLKTKLS